MPDFTKVMDEASDSEWKMILALLRLGGLRVGEAYRLKWDDIGWAEGTILVHSSKTEGHEGHGSRLIPIFGELLPYLLAAHAKAPDGAIYCVTKHRIGNCNGGRRSAVSSSGPVWSLGSERSRTSGPVEQPSCPTSIRFARS